MIDNKPGANTIIATEHVAKSAPDGYTILANGTAGMAITPVTYAKLPYDSVKDFAPISMLGLFPMVLVVHPSVPAKSVQELIAHLKANPGKLNYSSGTTGYQVAAEMFKQMTGTSINHIPFKGSAQSVNAVVPAKRWPRWGSSPWEAPPKSSATRSRPTSPSSGKSSGRGISSRDKPRLNGAIRAGMRR